MVEEAHDVHHPVSTALFYEDQKEAAKQAAAHFRDMRIPKYMAYFARALAADEGDWLAEGRWTYADLSLFHLVEGLRYAFPQRMRQTACDSPSLLEAHMEERWEER